MDPVVSWMYPNNYDSKVAIHYNIWANSFLKSIVLLSNPNGPLGARLLILRTLSIFNMKNIVSGFVASFLFSFYLSLILWFSFLNIYCRGTIKLTVNSVGRIVYSWKDLRLLPNLSISWTCWPCAGIFQRSPFPCF